MSETSLQTWPPEPGDMVSLGVGFGIVDTVDPRGAMVRIASTTRPDEWPNTYQLERWPRTRWDDRKVYKTGEYFI